MPLIKVKPVRADWSYSSSIEEKIQTKKLDVFHNKFNKAIYIKKIANPENVMNQSCLLFDIEPMKMSSIGKQVVR